MLSKKKKTLYKRFLKNRIVESERKYKSYKNKLTNIKRFCEQEYYSNLLDENKNNIKETWKILNTIINKKSKNSAYPQQFNDNQNQKRYWSYIKTIPVLRDEKGTHVTDKAKAEALNRHCSSVFTKKKPRHQSHLPRSPFK